MTTRRSLATLTPAELESFLKALKRVQAEDLFGHGMPTYEFLAGIHGQPGQYCTHHEERFPVWHRVYVRLYEKALTAAGSTIGLPYLDWMTVVNSVPPVLCSATWQIDGQEQPNPLFSYAHERELKFSEGADVDFLKNSATHRFPFVTNFGGDQAEADKYNQSIDSSQVAQIIGDHFAKFAPDYDILTDFNTALGAPTYRDFVYTDGASNAQALEVPHDSGHGLIGYGKDGQHTYSGDMGDPNTAGFDPIFWLHHCFVDYVFDVWWSAGHTISASLFSNLTLPFPDNTTIEAFGVSSGWTITDDLLAKLKANEGITYVGTLVAPSATPASAPSTTATTSGSSTTATTSDSSTTATTSGSSTSSSTASNSSAGLASIAAPVSVPVNAASDQPAPDQPAPDQPVKKVYVFKVSRLQIPGAFTVYAKNKETGVVLDKQYIFNRRNPNACENCKQFPVLSFSLSFVPQDYVLSYALSFAGKDEQEPGDIFQLVEVRDS